MIHAIRGHAIIDGVRGEAGMDEDVLADYIQRLGLLVSDFPQISEIDLNPIKGTGTELCVVDARIIVPAK
jgi:acetyltransferase